jgi:phenylalanine-4-hydroxylase
MMQVTNYKAYIPDENGYISYTDDEHAVWEILYKRQIDIIQERACSEYIAGIKKLELDNKVIPQPVQVSSRLREITGWIVEPVPALINFKQFFQLLSERKFPTASFIRKREELDYLKEPDIFHEIFGHCPLLTNESFAAFTYEVGRFGTTLDKEGRIMLARLYWFTVEFGLMQTNSGLRIYGAGILSSKAESVYALESQQPLRKKFDLIEVLRTSYRYDQLQQIYYIIDGFDQLYNMISGKLLSAFNTAKELGMLMPIQNDIHAC